MTAGVPDASRFKQAIAEHLTARHAESPLINVEVSTFERESWPPDSNAYKAEVFLIGGPRTEWSLLKETMANVRDAFRQGELFHTEFESIELGTSDERILNPSELTLASRVIVRTHVG